MTPSLVQPVILSGGSGTRLWPLSRASRPKQFLPLAGERSMLELTLERVADRHRFLPAMVVGSAQHEGILGELSGNLLILEPAARNTAAAIALAAMAAAPDTPLLVMPSDHVIADLAAFDAAVQAALPLALGGWLLTLGIRPDHPETGYGYIKQSDALSPGVFRVERFVEKPDAATAAAYLESGDYLWNAGIFLFRAGDYLAELGRHAPDIVTQVAQAMERGSRSEGVVRPDKEAFAAAPAISIDYAVMEKSDRVAVAPVSMGWSDIGSWDALHTFLEKDESGNAADASVIAMDASGCLIRSSGPTVTAIGVKDLVIIATADAVLVLPRGDGQRVSEVVERLKAERPDLLG